MTAMPRAPRVLIRSSTWAVCDTPSAAVGSSMMTSLASRMTARATATDWRWPPESEPTSWRTDWTVVTERSASVFLAVSSIRRLVEQAVGEHLVTEEHVLDDVQVVAQGEILVHGGDPERVGVPRGPDVHRPSLPDDLAGGRCPDARDRLDQRRLAGTVVPDQRGDLPGRDVEVDAAERLNGTEMLGDPRRLSSGTGGARVARRPTRRLRGAVIVPRRAGHDRRPHPVS